MAVDDNPRHETKTRTALINGRIASEASNYNNSRPVYQESLIQECEQEIREIENSIHELSEIFRDLGTLVHQQGGMLDNIESTISSMAVDVQGGADELRTASEY
ncbi:hypothetical protein B0H13DRAFT_2663375 [Mycena leptocephala]|nr:hypothetical protein B0H13DRAFT_2663375 [Mycena leptocephala]